MAKLHQTSPLFVKFASIVIFSKIGDRLFYTALLSSATLLTTKSSLAVTLVSLSETLPILCGFLLGSFADRQADKLRHLLQTGYFRMGLYLIIGFFFSQNDLTFSMLLFISILNFCSDLSGNYATALSAPFTKVLVPAQQMPQAQGFLSIGSQIFNVIATFLGSFLLVFLTASHLAFLNALVFLTVTLAFKYISSDLKPSQYTLPIQTEISLKQAIKQNFASLYRKRSFFSILIQLTLLNGFFGGLTPLFALLLKNSSQLIFISMPLKLALLSGLITGGMILGNLLCQKLFKQLSLSRLTLLADWLTLLTALSFLFQNVYLILWSSSLAAFLLGLIAPRFSAQLVNTFAVTQLGGLVTITNSCLVIMPPLTGLLFPLLHNFGLAYLALLLYGSLLVLLGLIRT